VTTDTDATRAAELGTHEADATTRGNATPTSGAAQIRVAANSPSHENPTRGATQRATSSGALIKGAILSLVRARSVRVALVAFVLTRLIVFSLFVLTAKLDIVHPDPQSDYGAARLSLHSTAFARILRKRTNVADCNWYMGIAAHGYERRPFSTERETNWAFFPLYPLLLRAAALVTGELNLTGIALSTLCFFCALVLLHKLAEAFGFSSADADRAVFYLAAFPVSYFFSIPLTESLFLLLTIASFYAAKRERWLIAGLIGALASATRSTGVLLLPALAILYWETYRTFRPRWNFIPLLLIPTGLLSFMYFLHATTGNAFAFKDILVTWGRKPTFFLFTLFEYLRDPLLLAVSWDFRLVNFLAVAGAILCGVALLAWRKWSLAAYTLASVFVALSSGLLQSQARYVMVLFPAFLVLAVWGRNARADQIIRTTFLILLTLMTILFALHIDIALA
jgi:Gpi18-like mannosyltransferase